MKNLKVLFTVLFMTCAGLVWGETYTITFITNTSDGITEIRTSTETSTVISSGTDYVSGFTSSCSKAYYASVSGVKLGTSKAAGTIEFNVATTCQENIKKITVKSAKYSSDKGTLTLYSDSTSLKTGITPGTDYTHTFDNATKVSSIKLVTSSNRAYVSEIILETGPTKTTLSPTLSYTSNTLTVGGDNSSGPTVTGNTGNGTCTYSLENVSPADCATINSSTGVVTPVAAGTATAKVTIAETASYQSGTATFDFTINEPPYTITAQSNNESLGTVALDGKVITATPASCVGYASTAYTVTSGTATVAQDGNTFTVTPSSNCTVTINFEAKTKDTYEDGVHSTSMENNYCGSYTAPSIADKTEKTSGTCEEIHYHFVGWVAAANKSNPTDSNIIKSGTSMTANGTTYHAVWAKKVTE